MTERYKRKHFNQDEIEWAISLMEKEYERQERNTPEKMAELISKDFDVICNPSQIYSFFGLEENYELINKKIENYGSSNISGVSEIINVGNPHR